MATKKRRRKITPVVIIFVLIAAVAAVIYGAVTGKFSGDENQTLATPPVVPDEGTINVHFIDVGQADCILFMTEDGNMIIDAGTNSSEDELKLYLDNLGITSFKYAVFTHFHEDHIGGADLIMNNYDVENVILPDAVATTVTYEKLMDAIEKSDAKVTVAVPGETFYIGALQNTILAPNSAHEDNANNTSVVLKTEYGNTSFMLTGDAEVESEEEILEKFGADALKCDLLKMGHHGSSTSTSDEFLKAVSPSIAVISCGVDNSYGHPHAETLEKLNNAGIKYYRTDLLGSVVFKSDGESITFVENNKK